MLSRMKSNNINPLRTGNSLKYKLDGPLTVVMGMPKILIKSKGIFKYKLAVGPYFMILHLISYFHKCTALFLG